MVADGDLTNQIIAGKYRLDHLIGQGGFGAVYAGEHLAMARPVAVKVISMDHANIQSQSALDRFSREARVISQLKSPFTVSVFDYGASARVFYLVMERVDGVTLKQLVVKEGGLAPRRAARLASQILQSLEEAHHKGVLHRDMKPSNIMVFNDFRGHEQVKVLDFGIAKVMESGKVAYGDSQDLTQNQGFVGTPRYSAPEQLFNQNTSAVTDVYGVGLLLWEMLTGEPAIPYRVWGECSKFHIENQERPMRMPSTEALPSVLVQIVERAVMRYARDRWESASAMHDALKLWLEDPERPIAALPTSMPDVSSSSVEASDFWGGKKTVDPNLQSSELYFGVKQVPMRMEDMFEAQPARQPERERHSSLLSRADWADSASHIATLESSSMRGSRGSEPLEVTSMADASVSIADTSAQPPSTGKSKPPRQPFAWRKYRSAAASLGIIALFVTGVVILLTWKGDDAESVLTEGAESVANELEKLDVSDEPERAKAFSVPKGRFSKEGIWLAVNAAKWKRTSGVEEIDLSDVKLSTAFYEYKGVTCEITLVEARSEVALNELLASTSSTTSVVRFDYRALKLHPVKGRHSHKRVSELAAHMKAYRRLVVEGQ